MVNWHKKYLIFLLAVLQLGFIQSKEVSPAPLPSILDQISPEKNINNNLFPPQKKQDSTPPSLTEQETAPKLKDLTPAETDYVSSLEMENPQQVFSYEKKDYMPDWSALLPRNQEDEHNAEELESITPEGPSFTSAFAEKAAFASPLQDGEAPNRSKSITEPWNFGDPDELIEFTFKDAELSSILDYIQNRFSIKIISDDIISPAPPQTKKIEGVRLSFTSEQPLSKKDTWALFLTFLKLAGFTVIPTNLPQIYRLTSLDQKTPFGAYNSPLPTFIGINPAKLPTDDTLIRYVYFARNTSLDTIKNLFDTMKSQTAPRLIIFPDIRAIVVTDQAYNIRTMLEIINELDASTAPEVMAILRLHHGDAQEIAAFYKTIVKEDEQAQRTLSSRLTGNRTNTLSYLPTGIRIIPEPRTNSLILLGSETGVKKVKDFIMEVLDRPSDLPFKFTKVYRLKNIEAEAAAAILSKVVSFKSNTEAAQTGSIRNGDQYFGPMNIVPEPSSNQLIITCSYPEWLKLEELLREIDVEQPQVALRVFIANIDVSKAKELGTQLRNGKPLMDGLLGRVSFQTSGLNNSPVIENKADGTPGAMSLLGDIVNLATGAATGSTYVTLGSDAWGVFLLMQMLEQYTSASITQTPFVIVTNNYKASISMGEKRSVLSQNIYDSSGAQRQTFKDDTANLSVEITPRISYEGFITLSITVHDDQFIGKIDSGDKTKKELKTTLTIANKETAVLGGFLQDTENEHEYRSNPLSKIPLVGWLFGKVRRQSTQKSSLLIFITPEIIPTSSSGLTKKYTDAHINDLQATLNLSKSKSSLMDPIHRWMFENEKRDASSSIQAFVEKENRYIYPNQKAAKKRSKLASISQPLGSFL